MKPLIPILLVATLLLTGCYEQVTVVQRPPPPPGYYPGPYYGPYGPPPPVIVERYGPAPYPGAIWIRGRWFIHRRHWVWRRGYWR